MSKLIDQLIDNHGHLIEFIYPCHGGQTLVRWFSGVQDLSLKTQQLLPKESADWVKQGLLRDGYHQT